MLLYLLSTILLLNSQAIYKIWNLSNVHRISCECSYWTTFVWQSWITYTSIRAVLMMYWYHFIRFPEFLLFAILFLLYSYCFYIFWALFCCYMYTHRKCTNYETYAICKGFIFCRFPASARLYQLCLPKLNNIIYVHLNDVLIPDY